MVPKKLFPVSWMELKIKSTSCKLFSHRFLWIYFLYTEQFSLMKWNLLSWKEELQKKNLTPTRVDDTRKKEVQGNNGKCWLIICPYLYLIHCWIIKLMNASLENVIINYVRNYRNNVTGYWLKFMWSSLQRVWNY